MTGQEARQWVVLLAAHYPRVQLQQAHYDAYTMVVQRYPAAGAAEVLAQLASRAVHWPSTAEIAQAFATAAVGAPLAAVAWEQVQAYVAYRPSMADCPRCNGRGDEPWALLPGAMTQTSDWSQPSGTPCSQCRGRCEVDTGTRPVLHPVARRTLDSMGGAWAVRTHEHHSILRAQFCKAYDDFTRVASEAAALGRAWQPALGQPVPQGALARG